MILFIMWILSPDLKSWLGGEELKVMLLRRG